jgi:hypothetical protein
MCTPRLSKQQQGLTVESSHSDWAAASARSGIAALCARIGVSTLLHLSSCMRACMIHFHYLARSTSHDDKAVDLLRLPESCALTVTFSFSPLVRNNDNGPFGMDWSAASRAIFSSGHQTGSCRFTSHREPHNLR